MGNLQNNLFKEFGQLIIASIRMSGKGLRERVVSVAQVCIREIVVFNTKISTVFTSKGL